MWVNLLFSVIFAKGNNLLDINLLSRALSPAFQRFVFSSRKDLNLLSRASNPFLRRVYSSRKEFAPAGANSFFAELIPDEKRGKMNVTGLGVLILYPFTRD